MAKPTLSCPTTCVQAGLSPEAWEFLAEKLGGKEVVEACEEIGVLTNRVMVAEILKDHADEVRRIDVVDTTDVGEQLQALLDQGIEDIIIYKE